MPPVAGSQSGGMSPQSEVRRLTAFAFAHGKTGCDKNATATLTRDLRPYRGTPSAAAQIGGGSVRAAHHRQNPLGLANRSTPAGRTDLESPRAVGQHAPDTNMRAAIQRVSSASVTIAGQARASIQTGLLVLLGIEDADTSEDIEWLSGKIARLRIFGDEQGLMNRSVQEAGGDVLVISQFTLHASTKKGNRPSFIRAARPEAAIPLYEAFVKKLGEDSGRPVFTGEFGADMKVALVNDGPVTIVIDSKARE